MANDQALDVVVLAGEIGRRFLVLREVRLEIDDGTYEGPDSELPLLLSWQNRQKPLSRQSCGLDQLLKSNVVKRISCGAMTDVSLGFMMNPADEPAKHIEILDQTLKMVAGPNRMTVAVPETAELARILSEDNAESCQDHAGLAKITIALHVDCQLLSVHTVTDCVPLAWFFTSQELDEMLVAARPNRQIKWREFF